MDLPVFLEMANAMNSTYIPSFDDVMFNITDIITSDITQKLQIVKFGENFYAYITPVILIVGLLGNALSLGVFVSKNLRHMAASRYLAVLSSVDICTLVFYVFGEWLKRGLKVVSPDNHVTFLDSQGVCQIWLFFSYVSRFLSAWLIVCFTCERFIGVCLPLRRRNIGSLKETSRVIVSLVVISCLAVVYKPIMSSVRTIRSRVTCTSKDVYIYESFVLDSIYALLITIVPFIIISTLNVLIIRRILQRNYLHRKRLITEESHIRLEFTFILLTISFVFIALSLPFLIIWVRQFLYSWLFLPNHNERSTHSFDYWVGILCITRTISYLNYCINFFLYFVTGAYFRKELKALFFKSYSHYEQCGKDENRTHQTHQTLL
mgnify:FL=1